MPLGVRAHPGGGRHRPADAQAHLVGGGAISAQEGGALGRCREYSPKSTKSLLYKEGRSSTTNTHLATLELSPHFVILPFVLVVGIEKLPWRAWLLREEFGYG